ncbi:adenylate cyclase [Mariprofundus aestuarium]|uniref:Adenylate cyclase n=1 Tax=Mariprofundus aestuarium TaxID=1921086 RepID=A0A2K8L3F2_MARES|nr:adenylate/guanylate cyclase domain-containing protein [Mariprofundus aestuarium]ATX79484.1 adenylate cyclase [Mariprofundus aestuarium]
MFYLSGAFQSAHDALSDLLQIQFSSPPASKPVVYLLITDASLIEADEVDGISWPWPRSAYAEAVRFLKNAGASEIVFDMIFTERSVHGLEDDTGFGNAIEDAGVILAKLSSNRQSSMSEKAAENNRLITERFALHVEGADEKMFHDTPYLRAPVSELTNHAKGLGDVKFVQDSDGVGRRIPLLVRSGNRYHPSLSLAAAASILNITSYQMEGSDLLLSGPSVQRRIPLDSEGMARPLYFGDSSIYDKYLLLRVIKSQIRMDEGDAPYYDPALFKDKVVIIGADATELKDFRPNPFNKANDPGAHYHGTAIHNILESGFLVSRYEAVYVLPILFLTSMLLAFVAAKYRATTGFSFTFLLLLLVNGVAVYLFKHHGMLIDMAATSVNLIGCFILATGSNYMVEARQRHFVTSAFGQYLSPDVVKALVDNPERLLLGGEVRTMTAFFSDIAGFSTISEKLTPEELVSLLNEYLTEMCDIIGKYHGTVDKFEGDAIMAFWGAPIYRDDHAHLALLASLEMQQRLEELRGKWAAEGKDQLYVRMGINSGLMLVGNMGSRTRMNYTIMGDAVNLASRLEAANKFYGTHLMISQKTKVLAGDQFTVRELDAIQVVGKKKPVHVYELLGKKGDVAENRLAATLLFEEGLTCYRKGDFVSAKTNFTAVFDQVPGDPPAIEFLRRIEALDKTESQGDWNGVFKADSK